MAIEKNMPWGFNYGLYEEGRIVTYELGQKQSASLKPSMFGGRCLGGDAIIEKIG